MRVYVVGAGAVGRYLGETLRRAGAQTSYAPRALADVVPVRVDLAVVAVKAFALDGAVATLRRALGEATETTVLCPINGVGNEETLAKAFGARCIVAAALTVPVAFDEAGGPRAAARGGMGLAPVGSGSANSVAAAFRAAGLPVLLAADYRALKWSKLALNVVANAACAILDLSPRELVSHREALDLEILAIRETAAVMRALGLAPLDLPHYPVRAMHAAAALPLALARAALGGRIARGRGEKPPSLLLDLRAGSRRTEVGVLDGAVAAAGASHGVPTPIRAAYARVLDELAADPGRRPAYRARPAALRAATRR